MREGRCTRIYKYRSLSGEFGRPAMERALLHSELYWTSPTDFNDPFDCMPVLYLGDDDASRRRFYARAAAAVHRGRPRHERRRQKRDMGRVSAARMEAQIKAEWPKWLASSAITCFSECGDHPLMWGHYADSHRGLCLIFDEVANEHREWFAFPVAYQQDRPRVDLTRFNEVGQMQSALLLKSEDWAYEREQRMIDWKGTPGYREFPRDLLRGVIFGAKMSRQDEEFMRGLLAQRPDVGVFRARVHPSQSRLEIEPA